MLVVFLATEGGYTLAASETEVKSLYLQAYNLFEQGDANFKKAELSQAKKDFLFALNILQGVSENNPNWHEREVDWLLQAVKHNLEKISKARKILQKNITSIEQMAKLSSKDSISPLKEAAEKIKKLERTVQEMRKANLKAASHDKLADFKEKHEKQLREKAREYSDYKKDFEEKNGKQQARIELLSREKDDLVEKNKKLQKEAEQLAQKNEKLIHSLKEEKEAAEKIKKLERTVQEMRKANLKTASHDKLADFKEKHEKQLREKAQEYSDYKKDFEGKSGKQQARIELLSREKDDLVEKNKKLQKGAEQLAQIIKEKTVVKSDKIQKVNTNNSKGGNFKAPSRQSPKESKSQSESLPNLTHRNFNVSLDSLQKSTSSGARLPDLKEGNEDKIRKIKKDYTRQINRLNESYLGQKIELEKKLTNSQKMIELLEEEKNVLTGKNKELEVKLSLKRVNDSLS